MIKYIFIFFISPLVEWFVHKLRHIINNFYHEDHHKLVSLNNFKNFTKLYEIETWPAILISIFIYTGHYLICFGLLKYWLFHTIIHFYNFENPFFKELKQHHLLHHKYKKYNFAVSSTWPDKLMNTYIRK